LILTNRDPGGEILIDARLSNGGVPFEELEVVPGFPRSFKVEESFEIVVADQRELLYRRSRASNENYLAALYRIALPKEQTLIKGSIWPTP
jgi:hypothetical protein